MPIGTTPFSVGNFQHGKGPNVCTKRVKEQSTPFTCSLIFLLTSKYVNPLVSGPSVHLRRKEGTAGIERRTDKSMGY
jgi:hypothetical protein